MRIRHVLAALLTLTASLGLLAEPTPVTVHVLSRDGKFVGSSVGGAQVVIAEATTGKMLAQGITRGETGDTDLIVRTARKRGSSIVTAGTAGFAATLDLQAPTRVRVSAYGPLDYPQSANSVSATRWLLPGQDLSAGDGWLLELPGLIVELEGMPDHPLRLDDGAVDVPLTVHVAMMCGCKVEPGGLWDVAEFEVEADLLSDGGLVRHQTMTYAGKPSEFAATVRVDEPGNYRVRVTARQPRTGNGGVSEAALGIAAEQ